MHLQVYLLFVRATRLSAPANRVSTRFAAPGSCRGLKRHAIAVGYSLKDGCL